MGINRLGHNKGGIHQHDERGLMVDTTARRAHMQYDQVNMEQNCRNIHFMRPVAVRSSVA